VIAYLAGIALPFTGFVGTLGAKVSTQAADRGDLGWCLSFTTSFVVYWAICLVWPTKNQKLIKEAGLTWEELGDAPIVAEDGTEIVEEGKVVRERSFNGYGEGVIEESYGASKNY